MKISKENTSRIDFINTSQGQKVLKNFVKRTYKYS